MNVLVKALVLTFFNATQASYRQTQARMPVRRPWFQDSRTQLPIQNGATESSSTA